MNRPKTLNGQCLTTLVLVMLTTLMAGVSMAADSDVVYLKGNQTTEQGSFLGGPADNLQAARRSQCEQLSEVDSGNELSELRERVPALHDYIVALAPAVGGLEKAVEDYTENFCTENGDGNYTAVYTECSLTMWDSANYMKITVPPGSSTPKLVVYPYLRNPRDASDQTAMKNSFNTVSRGEKKPDPTAQVSATGATGEHSGYATREYSFYYQGEIDIMRMAEAAGGQEMQGMGELAGMLGLDKIVFESNGTAWISDSVPGLDVVQAFYRNYATYVQPSDGGGDLMSGMIDQLAAITAKGLPMVFEHTITANARSGMFSGMMGPKGKTRSTITRVFTAPGERGGRCEDPLIPDDYQVMDLSEVLAGTQTGTGDASAVNAEMQQLNEAMEGMSPQDRESLQNVMSGMGLEGLIPGTAAPTSQPAATAPARSGPTSDELYSDNLTQWVQRMLQTLGMDPGNTDGKASLDTTIAISQFQAEHGMEITGEVSPQLAGSLAAEVDKRGN